MADNYKLLIGGELTDAASGESFDSIDPSTGETFAQVAKGGAEDARRAAEDFDAFAEPGYAKAAWNFRVTPGTGGRCMVTTETRVRCTDDASRRRFVLYWAVVGLFSGVVRKQGLKLIKRDAEGSS